MKRPVTRLPNTSATDRVLHILLLFLRLSMLLITVWALLGGAWETFFISLLAIALSFTPEIIETRYRIELPIEFDMVIVVFMYLSVFIGETFDAYERFFWWDAMLHTASGVVLGFGGFLLLYILYRQGRLKTSPFIIAMFTFSFGVALGGVWEIFEFAVDSIFGTSMQKSGLVDTMWDLIVDAIGSLAVSIAGYHVIKRDEGTGILRRVLDKFFAANPQFEIGDHK